jgi:hypothetical protein
MQWDFAMTTRIHLYHCVCGHRVLVSIYRRNGSLRECFFLDKQPQALRGNV